MAAQIAAERGSGRRVDSGPARMLLGKRVNEAEAMLKDSAALWEIKTSDS
jgi:hypothetical protein